MTFDRLSEYALAGVPFLFFTDFKGERLHLYRLDELEAHGILYAVDSDDRSEALPTVLDKEPIDFETYRTMFDQVIEEIRCGDTYLLNLTQPTPIRTSLSLKEIFERAHARFKLYVPGHFVCFSPEPFVRIEGERISTYPMKGTIDASVANAEAKILGNPKEMAEHVMIVDLLRNDLGIVANDIRVDRFRYTETISAGTKRLIQVSSAISGSVGNDWRRRLGSIIQNLLPAGSVSGTPKRSTVKIIENIESYERGFFTGVFGVYDGKNFESAVMIRFIEAHGETMIYKSGGGITLESDAWQEYQEMLDKVYIP